MPDLRWMLRLFVLLVVLVCVAPSPVDAQESAPIINSVDWSPDGTRIATGDSDSVVKIWDAATLTLLSSIETRQGNWHEDMRSIVDSVDWNSDSRRLAVGISTGGPFLGYVEIVDTESREMLTLIPAESSVESVAWSPDGSMLAAGGWREGWIPEGWIKVWDAANYELIADLTQGDADTVEQVSWSPDGAYLASAAWDETMIDNNVWVWGTAQWQPKFVLEHTDFVFAAAWSSDGTRIVTAGSGVPGRVWDAETGQLLFELQLRDELPVHGAGFVIWRPQTYQVLSVAYADYSYWIMLWDASTGRLIHLLPIDAYCNQFAFSPDGTLLAYNSFGGLRLLGVPVLEPVHPQ
jgi:WD40 repeat protein